MDKLMLLVMVNCLTFGLMAQSHIKNVEGFNTDFYKNKELTTERATTHKMNVAHVSNKKSRSNEIVEPIHSLVEQSYETKTKDWVNHSKYEYGYDEEGNKSTAYWHVWNKSENQWLSYLKKHPEYDDNGNLSKITTYRYAKSTQNWVEDGKLTFTYDNKNKLKESIYYNFHKNNWRKADKKEFYYNGRVEETIQYIWSASDADWQTNFKNKNVYDAYGNLETVKIVKWDTKIGRWINFKRDEFEYTENGQLLNSTNYFWALGNSNDAKGEWVAKEKTVNTFEGAQNLIQSAFYKWDKTNKQWMDAHKKEFYQHNTDGQAAKSALFYWNPAGKVWIKGFQSIYNLSPKQSPLALVSSNLKVYPNPTDDVITFDIDKGKKPIRVQLFDMKGKEILSQILKDNGQVKVGHFSEAMYLYKLQKDGVTYTGKFSVK